MSDYSRVYRVAAGTKERMNAVKGLLQLTEGQNLNDNELIEAALSDFIANRPAIAAAMQAASENVQQVVA